MWYHIIKNNMFIKKIIYIYIYIYIYITCVVLFREIWCTQDRLSSAISWSKNCGRVYIAIKTYKQVTCIDVSSASILNWIVRPQTSRLMGEFIIYIYIYIYIRNRIVIFAVWIGYIQIYIGKHYNPLHWSITTNTTLKCFFHNTISWQYIIL